MDPRHARYPFFDAAREAVEEADVSLVDLVTAGDAAVERGAERVERALMEGTVEAEDPSRWSNREELLSYPIARVLVSLVDSGRAVEKYAEAEAATASERFAADFEADGERELRSARTARVELDGFLREFGLSDAVRAESDDDRETGRGGHRRTTGTDWFRVEVGTYLGLADAAWGEEWRLVNRALADGRVRVRREELYRLLRAAVRDRVATGLPFTVRGSEGGDAIADALESRVADLRTLLSDGQADYDVDTVVPGLFPPCMRALLDRTRRGSDLPEHARFALTAFLTGIGMDTDEVVDLYRAADLDEEAIRYQTEYLRDASGSQYPAPSCATMQAYGVCVNMDDRCEQITHPMTYYGMALSEADPEQLNDWRES